MRVTLSGSVLHDGVEDGDGDVLDVTDDQADALKGAGVAMDAPPDTPPVRQKRKVPGGPVINTNTKGAPETVSPTGTGTARVPDGAAAGAAAPVTDAPPDKATAAEAAIQQAASGEATTGTT